MSEQVVEQGQQEQTQGAADQGQVQGAPEKRQIEWETVSFPFHGGELILKSSKGGFPLFSMEMSGVDPDSGRSYRHVRLRTEKQPDHSVQFEDADLVNTIETVQKALEQLHTHAVTMLKDRNAARAAMFAAKEARGEGRGGRPGGPNKKKFNDDGTPRHPTGQRVMSPGKTARKREQKANKGK